MSSTSSTSTGSSIGNTIADVGNVVGPVVATLDPPIGAAVTLAFKVLAVIEPAAYNAISALLQGQALTPEQVAAMQAIETKLQNPDSYLS
jgi:hypothetical protein